MPKAKPLRTRKHRAFNPYSNPESEIISEVIQIKGNNKLSQHQESEKIDGGRDVADSNNSLSLSKGQKKRLERKKVIMQKIGLIAPALRSNVPKPKKFDSLYSELEASINSHSMMVDASGEQTEAACKVSIIPAASCMIKSNKVRKAVAIRETQRMRLVQQNPLFLLDPIAAATLHLQQMAGNKQQQNLQLKSPKI
eukprot:gene26527-35197_t